MDSETNCQQKNLFTTTVIFNNGIPFKTSRSYSTCCLLSKDFLVKLKNGFAWFILIFGASDCRKNVEHIKNSLNCPIILCRPAFVLGTFNKGECWNLWRMTLKWRYCHLLEKVFSMKKPIGNVAAGNQFQLFFRRAENSWQNCFLSWDFKALSITLNQIFVQPRKHFVLRHFR